MNTSTQDEAAARLFEQQYFAEGAMYGSRKDYFRDVKMERYRTSPEFRELVDGKLEFSVKNNPSFDMPAQPVATQPASVTAITNLEGHTTYHVATGGNVGAIDATSPGTPVEDQGPKVIRDAFGRVTASVRSAPPSPDKAKPTGVQTEPANGVFNIRRNQN
jgi:hypothetical protein